MRSTARSASFETDTRPEPIRRRLHARTFAQGPIGLCATVGAKLMGATAIIGVETVPARAAVARRLGADHIVDFRKEDPVEAIMRLTNGRGVDVAIEALGTQAAH